MPTNTQSREPLDRGFPKGFLDPASSDNEEYGTAERRGGGYWHRTSGGRAEGMDDEDVPFGGYGQKAPLADPRLNSNGNAEH